MLLDLLPAGLRPYAKAAVAAFLPVLTIVLLSLVTGIWNESTLAGALVGAFASLGVIVSKRLPTAKTLVTAVAALLGLVATGLLTDAWNALGLAGAGAAILSALFVHQARNES